jgi:N-acetylglutamate synthase-like GNAT family acetyltransferase
LIEFREAIHSDIPALLRLLELLFTQEAEFSFNEKMTQNALNEIIKDNSIGEIFIATHNNTAIAMVSILYTISSALGGRVGLLEDMIVHPKYRFDGGGSQLLQYALKKVKDKNLKRLTLLTDESNTIAHHFYTKHEFKKSSMIAFRKLLS